MQKTGGENEGARLPDRHSLATNSLAEDVARLYSWANLGENSYRSFSRIRQPRPLSPPDTVTGTTAPDQNEPGKEPARVRFSDPSKRPAGADGVRNSVVGIYSVAGGVGKTSLCVNLGRMLCSLGEQILLVDVTGGGHLPFYFGASDGRDGLRTFTASNGSCSPIKIFESKDPSGKWFDEQAKSLLQASQRSVLDLGAASAGLLSQLLGLCDLLLVPLSPGLNSLLTVSRIDSLVGELQVKEMHAPFPFYVLNAFDLNNPKEIQARDAIARLCGDRLVTGFIRRSDQVSEASAKRMNVMDYAPESEVARDYFDLAMWVRSIAPAIPGVHAVERWSEQ
jgi:cellulose biosynthesis protein BcsQ